MKIEEYPKGFQRSLVNRHSGNEDDDNAESDEDSENDVASEVDGASEVGGEGDMEILAGQKEEYNCEELVTLRGSSRRR
jgi:hypothetical protein